MNYDNNYNNGYNSFNSHNPQLAKPPVTNQPNANLYDFSDNLNNSSNGYSNENVTFTSSKKKKLRISPLLAFLEFLIIVFLCLYIANDKGYLHLKFLDNLIPAKKETTPEPTPEVEPNKKKEETAISDAKLITDFKIRAYYMGNIGVSFDNLISPIFSKDTKVSELTDDAKLQAIIMGALTVESKYQGLTDRAEYEELFPTIAAEPANEISVIKYVDAAFIDSRYKLVFGEAPKNKNIENSCPVIVYSEKYQKYYLNPYCESGMTRESISQYAYRITTDGEKFYVYISIAPYRENDDKTFTVFKDPKLTEKYQDFASEEEYSTFELNGKNYKEFSKYKITFIQKGSEYAFESIEKVEDTTDVSEG